MSEHPRHIDSVEGFTDEELEQAARGGAPAKPEGVPGEQHIDSVPGFSDQELEAGVKHSAA